MDPPGTDGRITSETRALMTQMLDFIPAQDTSAPSTPISTVIEPKFGPSPGFNFKERSTVQSLGIPAPGTPSTAPTHLSSIVPSLMGLIGKILAELESSLPRLLSLNPS